RQIQHGFDEYRIAARTNGEAETSYQSEHPYVFLQDLAHQALHAVLTCQVDQPAHQVIPETLALPGIANGYRKLGLTGFRVEIVTRYAQGARLAVRAAHGNEGHLAIVVEMAQSNQALVRKALDHAEKTHANRLLGKRRK